MGWTSKYDYDTDTSTYMDNGGKEITNWSSYKGYEDSKCKEANDSHDEDWGSDMSTAAWDMMGWADSAAPLATCGVAVIAAVSAALF